MGLRAALCGETARRLGVRRALLWSLHQQIRERLRAASRATATCGLPACDFQEAHLKALLDYSKQGTGKRLLLFPSEAEA